MPVMSGMEFLEALSQREMDARPKIIFCTTENGLGHIKAALEAGADEYVMKPFDRDTLESKLQLVGVICRDLRMASADMYLPIDAFPRGRRIRLISVADSVVARTVLERRGPERKRTEREKCVYVREDIGGS